MHKLLIINERSELGKQQSIRHLVNYMSQIFFFVQLKPGNGVKEYRSMNKN